MKEEDYPLFFMYKRQIERELKLNQDCIEKPDTKSEQVYAKNQLKWVEPIYNKFLEIEEKYNQNVFLVKPN